MPAWLASPSTISRGAVKPRPTPACLGFAPVIHHAGYRRRRTVSLARLNDGWATMPARQQQQRRRSSWQARLHASQIAKRQVSHVTAAKRPILSPARLKTPRPSVWRGQREHVFLQSAVMLGQRRSPPAINTKCRHVLIALGCVEVMMFISCARHSCRRQSGASFHDSVTLTRSTPWKRSATVR